MAYTLSTDQSAALKQIGAWYRGKASQYLTLGGYAGTGKTTLIAYLRQALRQFDDEARVAFCAYTGKATRVLDRRLKDQKVPRRGDSVSTIHALIYTAKHDKSGTVTGWDLKEALDYDLIIVDEASMVDETIWQDLLSFDIPVLAVGDHGQLPPINSSFNLMASPQIRLERIFRQAASSPIVEVATLARTSGNVPVASYGDTVRKLDRNHDETGQLVEEWLQNYNPDLLVLCGFNATRQKLNQAIRSYLGFETPEPAVGDYVVCLRNDRKRKIYNGMTGTIRRLESAGDPEDLWLWASIEFEGEANFFEGYILRAQFGASETIQQLPKTPDKDKGSLFDFGYAMTVHKAQGSEALKVLLFEERSRRMSDDDWRRWLYTAVTRASQELLIVG
jgi:exodeoxyribonuclease-5